MKDIIFKTKDFYSSCLLRAYGIPLLRIEKDLGRTVSFCFDGEPEKCEEILTQHWNRNLKIESRLLIETINELKSRMYKEINKG